MALPSWMQVARSHRDIIEELFIVRPSAAPVEASNFMGFPIGSITVTVFSMSFAGKIANGWVI